MKLGTLKVLIKRCIALTASICLLGSTSLYGQTTGCAPCEQTNGSSNSSSSSKRTLRGLTTFIPRSQGDNSARELVGWQQKLFLCYDSNYAAIASTVEYTRSFDTHCIAKRLFTTNRLTFAGSETDTECIEGQGLINNRPPNDIVADYFGLSTDFLGTLAIKPLIENAIIDIQLYFGLEDSGPGLFLWVNAPIVHTRWTLGLDSCVVCEPKFRGCTVFPECYMYSGPVKPIQDPNCPVPGFDDRVPVSCPVNSNLDLPRRLRNADCTTQSLREALSGDFTFGDMTEPWKYGRFSFCPRSKTGLADIDVMVGWNIIQNDYAHFGIFGVTVVPTGNRPKAHYIFEPLIGDGKHWKLGGGASAHLSLFPNTEESCFNMGFYAYGRAVHVFETDQIRSFDFKQQVSGQTPILTRYMLLKEFNTAGEYNGTMINAINFATRNCEVKVGLLADISLKAFIAVNGWEFDIGYNFYYRHCENVCIKTDCPCGIDSRIFGFKGLEGVCCTPYTVDNGIVEVPALTNSPISTTQPNATMFNPHLPQDDPTLTGSITCLGWNSIQFTEDTPIEERNFDELTPTNCFIGINTAEPVFITCADLDARSAAQGEMRTNKVFGHLSYTFDSCYTPFVGIGAEGEFDAHHKNALQQWGIWIKAGASF